MSSPRSAITTRRRAARRGRPAAAPRLAGAAVAATTLLALAVAPSASADSFVYRDGRDVRTINAADDRTGVAITGDETHYATLPTMDDAGNITTIVRTDGSFVPELVWFGADDSVVRNVLPEVGSVGLNTGPLSVRIHPGGRLLAYTYLKWEGTHQSPTPQLAIVDPSTALAPTPAINRQGYGHATWFDGRLVVWDGSDLLAESSPDARFQFTPWAPGAGASSADVSRDGRRAVIGSGSRRQSIVELTGGGPPASTATASCVLPDDGSDLYRGGGSSAALSPDGRHVALAGQSGLRIATIGTITGEGADCPLSDVRLVSAKGGLPTSSAYTIPAPAPDPGPPAPGPGVPAPPADPGKPKTEQPKTTTAKRLAVKTVSRRGSRVTVRFACRARCSYDVRLLRGRRIVVRRKGTAKAGRTTKVVLKRARKGMKIQVRAAGVVAVRKLQ